jgi:hypothetical protein
MTTDYGVLECVQDLPFNTSQSVDDLDVLEGGSRFFQGRNLTYLKSETVNLSTGPVTLYGFRELGRGGAASEYWVDEHHRVIIAVMFGNRAIILNSSTTTDTTEFFSDGFSSFDNWVNSGCDNTSEKAYGDTRSCKLNGTDSILTCVSTSGKDGIIVKYRVDAKDIDKADTLSAQWYDGDTYHDIEIIHGEGPLYPWKAREFTLPKGASNNPDFRLRFVINSAKDEAFIDSVEMRYMSDSAIPNMTPPSPPPTPTQTPTPTATPGGTTVTLSAIDDAWVRGDGTQDGTGSGLEIKGTTNLQYARKSYIKFNAKGINGSVTSAKLRLYCTRAGADITVRKVPDDSWSEATITWANKPEVGPAQSTETTTAGAYIEWDITSLVVKQLSGDGEVSLELSDDSQTVSLVEFNSKEAGSNPPQLIIE